MKNADYTVVRPGFIFNEDPDSPYAPPNWTKEDALKVAKQLEIEMTEERWEIIHALQEYYAQNDEIKVRAILDALDEKFHHKGGGRYLLKVFPNGPINIGCRIAGLTPPRGSADRSFGSVF